MMDETSRFALPLLAAGQAQKEMTFNEAIAAIDMMVFPVVEGVGQAAPPPAPQPGQAWIVGPAPDGAWQDRAGQIAGWTAGGWRFCPPVPGMTAWLRPAGVPVLFDGGGWQIGRLAAGALVIDGEQVVGRRRPAIADPAGGGTVDAEGRAALAGVLAALRWHGLIAA